MNAMVRKTAAPVRGLRGGFTLLELMVASLLLAMLVTILTMIFNQSSIAWTTGVASVAGLGEVRRDMSQIGVKADNALDPARGLQLVSVWNPDGAGLRQNTGRTLDLNGSGLPDESMRDPYQDSSVPVGSGATDGRDTYVVGVASDGPDRQPHTWDDITTMPEEGY